MIDPRTDEGRHLPGAEAGWREWWGFDFVAPDHDLAGWAELVLFPAASTAWYHAFVVGADRQLVAVVDHDVPLPPRTLEIRTNGLWADHICETPGVHWTIGLEAFAVGLDDPAEMYGRQLGDQVPLGFDLEWDSDDPTAALVDATDGDVGGYSLSAAVSGEVLIGAEVIDLDATGTRRHGWGVPGLSTVIAGSRQIADTSLTVEGLSGGVPSAVAIDGARLEMIAVTPLAVPDPVLGGVRRPRALVSGLPGADGWAWVEWTEPSAGVVA